ncbi:hypothetical protein [Acinetobacter sp. HZNU-JH01]|uniref:hypothetical protein n=1 Tax=Acinetobacter sp. HZNU-JH01 TaxID=3136280 RepID=UPI0030F3925E
MSKVLLAITHGFKAFKNSSTLLEEMKQQIETMWILFEYRNDQGERRQSFALIEVIIDDISVPKNETFLTYHSNDFLSEELVAFNDDTDQVLYYQIIENEQFDVRELELFRWNNHNEELDGKLLYFRVPITRMNDQYNEVFLGWADFENDPPCLEMYTARGTKLVDVNDYPEREDFYFAFVPFLEAE